MHLDQLVSASRRLWAGRAARRRPRVARGGLWQALWWLARLLVLLHDICR